ncbi:MAG TPA: ABC transporter substrate-binding protein [Candidatus Nanoarchaeia archaeon]|nr:ABC transporter substrate-binding protein [Candidatus Nanoarchaeia archaeon]
MKTTIIGLLLLLILVACSTTETVKIGFIGPLTGTGAIYGTIELNAARLALEDVNANGGINGKQVELIVEDGKCEGAASATAATKLIEVNNVKYILGGHCSTESMSIVPVTEANKVLIMAGATGTDKFIGAGRLAFRTFPSATALYGKLAEVAFEKGTQTIVTFAEQKDWPQSVAGAFAKRFSELGGNVLSSETYEPGTQDFKPALLKIKELNPEAVMITVQGPDSAAQIIKQMHELGMTQQIYGDALVVTQATYEKTNGALPPNATGASSHVNPERSPETKAFLARYTQRFGAITLDPFVATEGYDGMRIVADLITACGDDTSCARTTLLSKQWNGASGTFHFNEQGDANPHIGIVRVENGTLVFEYEGE